MGELLERSNLGKLVYGAGIFENYRNNSLYFYEKYSSSDEYVTNKNALEVRPGGFYHFHYLDDSNWMKYSPVFIIDYKRFADKILILAINLNFLPIEIRIAIFDKFITSSDFEKDTLLKVSFDGAYEELKSFGFEYAIVEYNLSQVLLVHKINMEKVPQFLYAGHPKNKYDPKKLYGIWKAKLEGRQQREDELSQLTVDSLVDLSKEFHERYTILKKHVQRVRTSVAKYG